MSLGESTELLQSLQDYPPILEKNDQQETEKNTTPKSTITVLLGYVCGFMVAAGLAASVACAQALGGLVPTFQLNLWRFAVSLTMVLPLVAICRIDIRVPRNQIVLVFINSILIFAANITYYEAAKYLPTAEVAAMYFTAMLATTYIAEVVMKRQLELLETMALVVTVPGILLVLQPGFMFDVRRPETHPVCWAKESLMGINSSVTSLRSPENITLLNVSNPCDCISNQTVNLLGNSEICTCFSNISDINSSPGNSIVRLTLSNDALGYSLSILCGILTACICIITNRYLHGLNPMAITFWVDVISIVLSGLSAPIASETFVFPSSTLCVTLLFGHSLGVTASSIFMITASFHVPPNLLSLLMALEIIWTLCLQYTLLKDINPGYRNISEIIGAVLVLTANILGPFYAIWQESACCNKRD